MSNIDSLVEQTESKEVISQPKQLQKLKPFYRLLSFKFIALWLTITLSVGLTYVLFNQKNIHNKSLELTQVVPLTQQLHYIKTLQKADELVSNLLIAGNAENYFELHNELSTISVQSFAAESPNSQLFQQWLKEYKLNEDIVSRLQDSYLRNHQLKQNSIIQLQLMLLSIKPIIDTQVISQNTRYSSLQNNQSTKKITFNDLDVYAKSIKQLNNLQQIKTLLEDMLLSFEQLNINTPIANFERLRSKTEQLFALKEQVVSNDTTNNLVKFYQQFTAFEKIVLTEQSALAKWQGYIRLAQNYRSDLIVQQQKIKQLFVTTYEYPQTRTKGIVHEMLSQFDLYLSEHNIFTILISAIGLCLFLFFLLLWRLHRQIKVTTQHSVELIKRTFNNPGEFIAANCAETSDIMQFVNSTVKPLHDESEYQTLVTLHQSTQQLLTEQIKKAEDLTQLNKKLQRDFKAERQRLIDDELRRYTSIEAAISQMIQKHQIQQISQAGVVDGLSIPTQLNLLHQQLTQFQLALAVKANKSPLILKDINLIAELYAILFNKEQEQKAYNNELFIFCDEQLLNEVKIDFRLFQQLINLFIDIVLTNCTNTQLHLQVQLKIKSAGQQQVNFSVTINTKSLDILPDLATQLIGAQSCENVASPVISAFLELFTKQHGENIVAQLIDEGYQISFEIPLAITSTSNNKDEITLENSNIMLISNNVILSKVVEKVILSSKGKLQCLSNIEDFKNTFSQKNLSYRKLDLLVVTSDIAVNHLDFINEQINALTLSMRPKLMMLQSKELSYERFGFYNQAEQVFCKDTFLENITKLLASNNRNNQLLSVDAFVDNQYISTQLLLLLAVNSPQQYQNLQRLIQWLGFQVQVVSNEAAQKSCWETGKYSVLITEFLHTDLFKISHAPLFNIGVFSLSDCILNTQNSTDVNDWYLGELSKESTLKQLVPVLTPWLQRKLKPLPSSTQRLSTSEEKPKSSDSPASKIGFVNALNLSDDFVITEVVDVLNEHKEKAAFDFSNYLHNQGSVELALFMLDDYTQDNHQQLNVLIKAIKAKNIAEANLALTALTLNAKILAASTLDELCSQWASLLNCSDIPNHLTVLNTLIKDTRQALNGIDAYANTF